MDALSRADRIQAIINKRLHIDTTVEEADELGVAIKLAHPVPLLSIANALQSNNTPGVQTSKTRLNRNPVMFVTVPSISTDLMLILDDKANVIIIGVK